MVARTYCFFTCDSIDGRERLTMKFAVVLLVLLPLALSAEFHHEIDRRGIMDFLGLGTFGSMFDFTLLRETVQHIVDQLGNDVTEQRCEESCHNFVLLEENHLVHTFCTPICRTFQTLVQMLHITPDVSTTPSI